MFKSNFLEGGGEVDCSGIGGHGALYCKLPHGCQLDALTASRQSYENDTMPVPGDRVY